MIAGHLGLAAGVKARERQVPLWALMLATVWLDIVFAPLLAARIGEQICPPTCSERSRCSPMSTTASLSP